MCGQKFFAVWCIYPSEQTKKAPFIETDLWKCFYSRRNKEVNYLDAIIKQDTRSPGSSVVFGKCDGEMYSMSNELTGTSMWRS